MNQHRDKWSVFIERQNVLYVSCLIFLFSSRPVIPFLWAGPEGINFNFCSINHVRGMCHFVAHPASVRAHLCTSSGCTDIYCTGRKTWKRRSDWCSSYMLHHSGTFHLHLRVISPVDSQPHYYLWVNRAQEDDLLTSVLSSSYRVTSCVLQLLTWEVKCREIGRK